MENDKKEIISISDGEDIYIKLKNEIKKRDPEILEKYNVFLLGFYERNEKF